MIIVQTSIGIEYRWQAKKVSAIHKRRKLQWYLLRYWKRSK